MASFTDIQSQYAPYVDRLPLVDEMLKVGQYKQSLYDQGVQRIQSNVDALGGLDVSRSVDKQYLQSRINDLGNNLTAVAGGDFSNSQLVNSVGGMVKQVSKDPYIQAAVSSTANHRTQMQEMENDKRKGTLTPDNELFYSKQFSAYQNNPSMKDDGGNPIVFSGKYIPNFDVFKFAKEQFDAILPDGMTFDQVYETNPDGSVRREKVQVKDQKTGEIKTVDGDPIYSPVMKRMEEEGRFPNKVKATLQQIFSDPRVNQQLAITGQYDYRGYDSNALSNKVLEQKGQMLKDYNDKLTDLNIQKKLGKPVQDDIDALNKTITNTSQYYDNYAQMAYTNPDVVRGELYRDDVNSRYTTMFGQMKKKSLDMESPGWRANFDLLKEANVNTRWEEDKRVANEHWQMDYDQRERFNVDKGKNKGKGEYGEKTGPAGLPPSPANEPANMDLYGRVKSDYDQSSSQFHTASNSFIWETAFSGQKPNEDLLQSYINKGFSKDDAIDKVFQELATRNGESVDVFKNRWADKATKYFNSISAADLEKKPDLKDAYNNYFGSKRNFDAISGEKQRVDQALNDAELGSDQSLAAATKNVQSFKGKLGGKDITVTPDDYYDLAVYLRGNKSILGWTNNSVAKQAAQEAKDRLTARGKSGLIDDFFTSTSPDVSDPLTGGLRSLNSFFNHALNNVSKIDYSPVKDIYYKLNNPNYTAALDKRNATIKRFYETEPNLNVSLLSGNKETDESTLDQLRFLASGYGKAGNESGDFSSFTSSIPKLETDGYTVSLAAHVVIDSKGNPKIEVISFGKNNKRVGGMTISPDEAKNNLDIDMNALYEPKEVNILRNKMNFNNDRTSASSDVKNTSIYKEGDAWFQKSDFVGIKNSPLDVKANVIKTNGLYYACVYVSDGTNNKVRVLPGKSKLSEIYSSIQQFSNKNAEDVLNNK